MMEKNNLLRKAQPLLAMLKLFWIYLSLKLFFPVFNNNNNRTEISLVLLEQIAGTAERSDEG